MVDNELGLKAGTMSRRAFEMSERLMDNKDDLAIQVKSELPNAKIAKRIADLIGDRCKSLERQGI